MALFAALSYGITKSGRGSGDVRREQASLDAAAIISHAGQIQQTVQRLMLSGGCDDRQLSFQNATVAGYTNPSAPSSKSCHLFDAAGGGLSWPTPPPNVSGGEPYLFTGDNIFYGTTTSVCNPGGVGCNVGIVMYLPVSSQNLCLEINRRLSNPAALAIDFIYTGKFVGAAYQDRNIFPDDGGNTAGYKAVKAGCLQSKNDGTYPISLGIGYFFYFIIYEEPYS